MNRKNHSRSMWTHIAILWLAMMPECTERNCRTKTVRWPCLQAQHWLHRHSNILSDVVCTSFSKVLKINKYKELKKMTIPSVAGNKILPSEINTVSLLSQPRANQLGHQYTCQLQLKLGGFFTHKRKKKSLQSFLPRDYLSVPTLL